MAFYQEYNAKNEFDNLKLVEIDALHKFVAQTVQRLFIMLIFNMMATRHLEFEGQNGHQLSR